MAKQKDIDVGVDGPRTDRTMEMGEIGDPGPIEVVADTPFIKDEMELEAFMNQKILVLVHESTDEAENEIITPQVNGINQGIIRGKPQWIKRKYVEALARGRTTKYTQKTPDPVRPDNIQMVERSAHTYPFSVREDPDPRGRAWLEAINTQM